MKPLQERDHVEGGPIAKSLLGLVAIGVAAIAVATLLVGHPPEGVAPGPAPRTIGSIEQTPITGTAVGLELRDRQRESLETWRWVDRDAGVAAIPIERAMQIVSGGPP